MKLPNRRVIGWSKRKDPAPPQPRKFVNITLTGEEVDLLLEILTGSSHVSAHLLSSKLTTVSKTGVNLEMWFINLYSVIRHGQISRYTCIKSLGFSCKCNWQGGSAEIDPAPYAIMLDTYDKLYRSFTQATDSIVTRAGIPALIKHLFEYNSYFEVFETNGGMPLMLTIERHPAGTHSHWTATDLNTEEVSK